MESAIAIFFPPTPGFPPHGGPGNHPVAIKNSRSPIPPANSKIIKAPPSRRYSKPRRPCRKAAPASPRDAANWRRSSPQPSTRPPPTDECRRHDRRADSRPADHDVLCPHAYGHQPHEPPGPRPTARRPATQTPIHTAHAQPPVSRSPAAARPARGERAWGVALPGAVMRSLDSAGGKARRPCRPSAGPPCTPDKPPSPPAPWPRTSPSGRSRSARRRRDLNACPWRSPRGHARPRGDPPPRTRSSTPPPSAGAFAADLRCSPPWSLVQSGDVLARARPCPPGRRVGVTRSGGWRRGWIRFGFGWR